METVAESADPIPLIAVAGIVEDGRSRFQLLLESERQRQIDLDVLAVRDFCARRAVSTCPRAEARTEETRYWRGDRPYWITR